MSDSKYPDRHRILQHSPLWQRAPSRDENGKLFSDFMMLIPGLKNQPALVHEAYTAKIEQALSPFDNTVVYVDLNISKNLLWISIRPLPGVSRIIAEAVRHEIPEARMISSDFNSTGKKRQPLLLQPIAEKLRAPQWLQRLRQKMLKSD